MELHEHFINFPPYICCSWSSIRSIFLRKHAEGYLALSIALDSGEVISLPELPASQQQAIFKAYSQFLERKSGRKTQKKEKLEQAASRLELLKKLQSEKGRLPAAQLKELLESSSSMNLSHLADQALSRSGPMEDMIVFSTEQAALPQSTMLLMRHDPAAGNASILPKELLRKIRSFSKKILSQKELATTQEAVPGCHCPFCQITRAIEEGIQSDELTLKEGEEIVSDEELRFEKWRVLDLGDESFELTDPCAPDHSYRVQIQPEIQCSCGQTGCEHIVTILKKF